MPTGSELRPSLWRTCRVLANRRRLRIFSFLIDHPEATVSAIAKGINVPLSSTSKALRLLESRSLLMAKRSGSFVRYSVAGHNRTGRHGGLTTTLKEAFENHPGRVNAVFSLVAVFTQPLRIEIFNALRGQPQSFEQVRIATGVSSRALDRHLQKLESRGFIRRRHGCYRTVRPSNEVQRELVRLASY